MFIFAYLIEASTPTLMDLVDVSWLWLVDLERCCSLLVGRCLGGQVQGLSMTEAESKSAPWLHSPVMSGGVVDNICDKKIGTFINKLKLLNLIY